LHTWRRIKADGTEWEVRIISESGTGNEERDIIEFRPVDGVAQPRRTAVERNQLDDLSDDDLAAVYRRAAPIGGDHYGRPGKPMPDAR
jgi:hypothetical protein